MAEADGSPMNQPESHGIRQKLEILPPPWYPSSRAFLAPFGAPFSKIPLTPNLPTPSIGYNSKSNETAADERSRNQTEARGNRLNLEIRAPALISAFSGVFWRLPAPRFPKSSPPTQIYQRRLPDILSEQTKPPRPSGRGSRRKPAEEDGGPRKQTELEI